jgi:hypothetical protein
MSNVVQFPPARPAPTPRPQHGKKKRPRRTWPRPSDHADAIFGALSTIDWMGELTEPALAAFLRRLDVSPQERAIRIRWVRDAIRKLRAIEHEHDRVYGAPDGAA